MNEFCNFSLSGETVVPDLAEELPVFIWTHFKQLRGKKANRIKTNVAHLLL